MFEQLQERLEGTLARLRGQGRITRENIVEPMREVRRALLEADVNFKVAKEFVDRVAGQAMDQKVQKSIKPGQLFVKIIRDELTATLGGVAVLL